MGGVMSGSAPASKWYSVPILSGGGTDGQR